MLSGVITIGISAALFAFGIYNIVCGVMTEEKKAKAYQILYQKATSNFAPFGETPVQMKGRFSKGKI